MIEREFISQKSKEHYIKKYVQSQLENAGISSIKLKKIPLGEKIIIETSRPSLVVGSKGSNIKLLTRTLKKKFQLENPQIEINEVKNIFLDANIVAERIASSLERFGSARFKGVGHKTLSDVMNAGALGVELVISGKIPSSRARSWRFAVGYLKKCGDISIVGVRHAQASAILKTGTIGIKVAIMPPGLVLPDNVEILAEPEQVTEEITAKESKKEETKKSESKKSTTKKVTKKKVAKKEAPAEKKEVPKKEVVAEKKEVSKVTGDPVVAEKVEEKKVETAVVEETKEVPVVEKKEETKGKEE